MAPERIPGAAFALPRPLLRSRPRARSRAMAPPEFAQVLASHGLSPLRRASVNTLQVNVGKRCNQACHHCHVEAGPKRTERMDDAVASRLLDVLAASPAVVTVDVTGGAPELNPHFRR